MHKVTRAAAMVGMGCLLGLWGCTDYQGANEVAAELGLAGSPAAADVVSQAAPLEQSATVTLPVTSDTSVRASAPNQNFGTSTTLDVNRSLLKLETSALTSAVGATDYVVAATLRVTLVPDNNRRAQRQLGAHRVLKPWTETGATWQCAVDSDTGNRLANCSGATAWTMLGGAGTFVSTATGTATIPANRTGTVAIDVTQDVRAFLAGSATNYGWMLKTGVGLGGEVADLAARESTTPPQLALTLTRCNATLCDDQNVCTTDSCNPTGQCVHAAAPSGTSCDDGNACTRGDMCGASSCTPGAVAAAGTSCGAGLVCSATAECTRAQIVINEIESNGGSPDDWVELYNAGATPVDLARYLLKDNDDTHIFTVPDNTVIAAGGYYVAEVGATAYGLGGADSVRLYAPMSETPFESYAWTAHASTTYGRCPNGTGAITTTTSVTKGAANDCSTPPPPMDAGTEPVATTVVLNEIESNGGSPDDWVELYNKGAAAVNISGYRIKDNDDTHAFFVIPNNTMIAAGGYYVADVATVFGLGGADTVRFYAPTSDTPIESYAWTAHATTTYGRCPDGTGAFITTASSSKGAANSCGGGTDAGSDAGTDAGTFLAWPGSNTVSLADNPGAFSGNMSGLSYQAAGASTPARLWAVQNSPSKLYRLERTGSVWASSTSDGWDSGKQVTYPNGGGAPDCEGVTRAELDTPFMYISTERDGSGASRLSILRVDTSAAGTMLMATHEWNLTADLPAVGSNAGLEAIAWIPDSLLTARQLRVEGTNQPYNPSDYPNHGSGLFFVGVEQTGAIYAYALNHVDSSFRRIATIASGLQAVMDLEFDRDQNTLWTYCDDTCHNKATVLTINAAGQFTVAAAYEHPMGLEDINNEGIAIAPETECNAGQKAFFWSDDSATLTHSLRVGSIACGALF